MPAWSGRMECRGHTYLSFQALSINCSVFLFPGLRVALLCPTSMSLANDIAGFLCGIFHEEVLFGYSYLSAVVNILGTASLFYFLWMNSVSVALICHWSSSYVTPSFRSGRGLKYSNQETSGELHNDSKILGWDFWIHCGSLAPLRGTLIAIQNINTKNVVINLDWRTPPCSIFTNG